MSKFDPQVTHPNLAINELCEESRVLEALGRHGEAQALFGDLWPSLFEDPRVEFFLPRIQADVLLRVAVITSWVGTARRLPDARRRAREITLRALKIYQSINDRRGQADALCELGYIERWLGNLESARAYLADALRLAEHGMEPDLLGLIHLRRALIENAEQKFASALDILQESAHLFDAPLNDSPSKDIKKLALVGNYYNTRGVVHRSIALQNHSWEFFDAGYRDLTAAQFFFSQAGHKRWEAAALNNLALFALVHRQFSKAHEYVDRARHRLALPDDLVYIAQVEETRARIFAAEGLFNDAERVIEQTVDILKETAEDALLNEVLVVRDTIFAARENPEEARKILEVARPKMRLVKGVAEHRTPMSEIITIKVGAGDDSLAYLGYPPESIIPFELTTRAREGQFALVKIVPGDMIVAGFYHPNADCRTVMIDCGNPDYQPLIFPVWRIQIRGVHRTLQRLLGK